MTARPDRGGAGRPGDQALLSVGIDVGTTTTQVAFSRLAVANRARAGGVPRLSVDSVELVHVGPPVETPLLRPDEIDVEALARLVRREYRDADVSPARTDTGAVIVTGETARAKNAEAILVGLSDLAGDFVVSVAGPNVEALIAGRGSGAAAWSAANFASAINVDIGGGSSNAAHFRSGAHQASAAAMVGGRQARIDPTTGALTGLAPSGRAIVDALGLRLRVGVEADIGELRRLADAMADIVVDLCLGVSTELGRAVALTSVLPGEPAQAYFASGGVGKLLFDDAPAETIPQIGVHGDIGPLLAKALRENPRWRALPVRRPDQTLRATVLGASSQQVGLSGSTIWTDPGVLPLRSLPVVAPRLDHDGLADPSRVAERFADAMERWDRPGEAGGAAMVLDLPERLGFDQLCGLASGIARFVERSSGRSGPLVLATRGDYAKAIGQAVKLERPALPVVVIDQVDLDEGDHVDIGSPMFDGRVVPVSVKTLVFYGSGA